MLAATDLVIDIPERKSGTPLSFDVKAGEIWGILGPNGAGKSTTIGVISSLVNKTGGDVSIFGYSLDTQRSLAKKQIGVVPQEFNFNQFEKVFDIVVTQAGFYGIPAPLARERAEKYLRQLGLWDKRDKQSRTLSGGMKRRLMIARALVHEPELLILDEPTAGVDIELRRSMWDFLTRLNEQGKTIILTTHYIEEAEEMADRIGVISRGELILVEEKSALMDKLGQKQLRLQLQKPLLALPAELKDYPLSLTDDGLELIYHFDTQGDQTGIADLFRRLDEHGIDYKDLRSKQRSLEEIFVSLVTERASTDTEAAR